MRDQCRMVTKAFAASGADIGPLTRVQELVPCQRGTLPEALPTLTAFKGPPDCGVCALCQLCISAAPWHSLLLSGTASWCSLLCAHGRVFVPCSPGQLHTSFSATSYWCSILWPSHACQPLTFAETWDLQLFPSLHLLLGLRMEWTGSR